MTTKSPIPLAVVARDVEEFVTELKNLPDGWAFVGFFAVVAALFWLVFWMYLREGRTGASVRSRVVLAVLRCVVLATLALILLEPVRVKVVRRWLDSYTIVLVDSSSSMDLADSYRDLDSQQRVQRVTGQEAVDRIRRIDIVRTVLEKNGRAFFHGLTRNNLTRLFHFSENVQLQTTLQRDEAQASSPSTSAASGNAGTPLQRVSEAQLEFPATGTATNMERATRRAIESLGGMPAAAIVVLSDGGFNQGASADEVAAFARERRIPIHVVGVGDRSPLRNLRVTELIAPQNAFVQDPFALIVRLTADGMDGETVEVRLRETDASGGEGRIVDSKTATIGPGGTIPTLTFQRRQERPGRYGYTVEAPVAESESLADDNDKQVSVNLIESRTRVLIVSGSPSWDYQYVSRLLERDDAFDVSCWLQSADLSAVRDGDVAIDHLPITPDELFAYDVIVLMDPNPAEFPEPWGQLLDEFVTDRGGGFLLAAARPFTPILFRTASLKKMVDLLPITPDPEADLTLNRVGFYQTATVPLEISEASLGHPILQLGEDSAATKAAWMGQGDIHWHYPVLREKPAATVLFRHGDARMRNAHGSHVLSAVQFVGAGRSGFLGVDGTFRWRRQGEDRFNRFWIQHLRWLAEGKLLGGTRRGTMLTDNDQVSLGSAVTVTARLFDSKYEPLQRDQVVATVVSGDERSEFLLKPQPDRPGWFEGRFAPARVGNYRISTVMTDGSGQAPVEITREVRVHRPNLEIVRPQMDRAALEALAAGSAGGRYFEVDELDRIPDLIPDMHEEITVRSRPTAMWDNSYVLAILGALLSLEWAARKWKHLL